MDNFNTSSSDSEDISSSDFFLITSSCLLSLSIFCCYMKYLIKYHPGNPNIEIIRPTVNNDVEV